MKIKKLLSLSIASFLICTASMGQTIIGDKGLFKKGVEIGGKRVDSVSRDSTLANNSDLQIPTVQATKSYLDNRLIYFPTLQRFQDSVRALREAIIAGGGGNGANNYTVGTTFDPNTGLLSIDRNELSSLQVNIDGRYAKQSDLNDSLANVRQQLAPDGNNFPSGLSFNPATGILSQPRAGLPQLNMSLDGRYPLIQAINDSLANVRQQLAPDGNFYTTGGNFNPTNGLLQLTRFSLGNLNINMDGRYPDIQRFIDSINNLRNVIAAGGGNNYPTSGSFDPATGNFLLNRNNLTPLTVNLNGRYPEIQRFLDSLDALRGRISAGANVSAVAASSIADLKSKYPAFIHAQTQGYFGAGDGGGALYRWDAFSTATPDDVLVIQPNSFPGAGRWVLVVNDKLFNIKWAGAVGDNRSELAAIQKAIKICSDNGYILTGVGTYNLNGGNLIADYDLRIIANLNLTFRNGGYIQVKGLYTEYLGVNFINFSTAVLYYPTAGIPTSDVRVSMTKNYFDSCVYVVRSQSNWPAGRGMRQFNFSDNDIHRVGINVLSPKCDQYDMRVFSNLFRGVLDGGVNYRSLIVLGGNGTINVQNFTKNATIRHNIIRNIDYPQDNKDVSNQCFAIDGSSVDISFNIFKEVKAQNIYFSAEDATCFGNIHINDTIVGADYAVIAKNGSYRGASRISFETIRGYFGSAIYWDSQAKYAEGEGNLIDLKGPAANGNAAIRYQNYGPVKQIKMVNNTINQEEQTSPDVVGIQIVSSFPVEQTIIDNNEVYSRGRPFQIYGPTFMGGKKISFKDNKSKGRVASSIYGDEITFKDNEIVYPVDTTTSQFTISARLNAFIEDNKWFKDTLTPTSFAASLVLIPSDANRIGGQYFFDRNRYDPTRVSNIVQVENKVGILDFDGDHFLYPLAGNMVRFRPSAGMATVSMNNITSLGATGSAMQVQTTDTTVINFQMTNSTFLSTTLISNTSNAQRGTLNIDNCVLATTPAILKNWAIYNVKLRGAANPVTTTINRTLGFRDLQAGMSNLLLVNSNFARNVTIPDSSTTVLPIGVPLRIYQQGTGIVTVNAASPSITLNAPDGLSTTKQYQLIEATQISYNVWNINLIGAGTSGGGSATIDTTASNPNALVTNDRLKKTTDTLFTDFNANEFQEIDEIISLKNVPADKLSMYNEFFRAYRTAYNLTGNDSSIVIGAGVLRPRWGNIANGDTLTWEFLTPSDDHGSMLFTGVRAFGSSASVNVYYPNVDRVISFLAVPDEYLASKGVTVGASVGTDSARILMYAPASNLSLTTATGNGTGWNNGSFTWSSGTTTVTPGGTYSTSYDGYAHDYEYIGSNNYFLKYVVSGLASNTVKFELWDRVTNTKVTTAPTASDIIFLKRAYTPSLINPYQILSSEIQKNVFGITAANQSSSGNIWIFFIAKK